MATKIALTKLLESVGRGIDQHNKAARFGENPFTDIIGYHIYGELNLTLRLTAAETTEDAQRLLRILQEYTIIGEACATESQASLLEMQGERIHFLLPRSDVTADSITEVLRFSSAFMNAVYSRIGKTAGKEFQGFKMSVDHGRAILISSGVQANGSIVSLGPAANVPAKEMKRNGAAGCLRIKESHYQILSTGVGGRGWKNVNLRDTSAEIKTFLAEDMNERFLRRSDDFAMSINNQPEVLLEGSEYVKKFAGGFVNRAIKVRGFALRADLDGFSREVEEAFRKGETGIATLVTRFIKIMQYPEQFRAKIGKTIDLPFAGDCATVIVLPGDAGYADSREYLPVKAGGEWHSQRDGTDAGKQRWAENMGKAKWAIGIAGGDDVEGSDGYIVVAPIVGKNRDFLVAAGWSVGRSLDGQEADGLAGGDTAIPDVDYEALASTHRVHFEELNTIFWISRNLRAPSLKAVGSSVLATSAPVFVPHISEPVPQPRPYSE